MSNKPYSSTPQIDPSATECDDDTSSKFTGYDFAFSQLDSKSDYPEKHDGNPAPRETYDTKSVVHEKYDAKPTSREKYDVNPAKHDKYDEVAPTSSGFDADGRIHSLARASEDCTSPGKTATRASEGPTSPGKTATSTSEGSTSPGKTATRTSEGPTSPGKTATRTSEGSTSPGKTATCTSEGPTSPGQTATRTSEGSTSPGKTATSTSEGPTSPGKTVTRTSEGTTSPGKTATSNFEGPTSPGKTVTRTSEGSTSPGKTSTRASEGPTSPGKTPLEKDVLETINNTLNDACLTGQLNVVKDILDKHYMELLPDQDGRTPLYAACSGDQLEVVKHLVHRGYDVNHQDNEGKTPMHVALEHNHRNVYYVLVNIYGGNPMLRDKRNHTPLHTAVDNGYAPFCAKILEEFLEQDLASTDLNWLHLHAASHENKLDTVQRLLANHADVNIISSAGISALYVACKAKNTEVVDCLMRHGADPNSICGDEGETSLHAAVSHEDEAMVQQLLACANIDVNIEDSRGDTALHRAIRARQHLIIGMILEHDADINVTNNRGDTPLHAAVHQNDAKMIRQLLGTCPDTLGSATNAGVNASDRDGNTSLHLAVHNCCSPDLLQALLDRGAHVNARNHNHRTALLIACSRKREDSVDILLRAGADPNSTDKDGATSLHLTVQADCRVDIVQALVDHGVHVDATDNNNRTALQYAQNTEVEQILLNAGASPNVSAAKSVPVSLHDAITADDYSEDMLRGLIDQGLDVDAINQQGKTALMLACENKSMNTITILLTAGADPNIADPNGKAALHWSTDCDCDANVIKSLITHGAHIDYIDHECRTALCIACTKQRMDLVTILLEAGADPNIPDKYGNTAIHNAVRAKNTVDGLQMIIRHEAQIDAINDRNQTALHLACESRQNDSALLLLKSGANPNIADCDGNTSLHTAVLNACSKQTMQVMIERGVNVNAVNKRHQTAVYLACKEDSVGISEIEMLVSNGADVTVPTSSSSTCLHHAARRGHRELTDLLLTQPVTVDAQSNEGDTSLLVACVKGNAYIAGRLMDKGADLNIPDYVGNTPLLVAAARGRLEIVRELLERGASVNVQGQEQMTPLHATVCARQPSDEVVDVVLSFKPDVNARDVAGNTPLHIATRNRYLKRVKSLLVHGADTRGADKAGQTPFQYALQSKDQALIDAYINNDPAVALTVPGCAETMLHEYCKKGKADLVKLLVGCGTDLNTPAPLTQDRPITVAFEKGHTDIARILIDAGANVSLSPGPYRLTFLELVYHQRHRHNELLKYILTSQRCPMDLTVQNHDGETLLYRACWSGEFKIVELLLGLNRDIGINICNSSGKSPLSITCETAKIHFSESLTIASLLLGYKKDTVDVNCVDSEGKSALHRACECDRAFLITVLLYCGASVGPINARDNAGRTPLSYANNPDVINLLLKAGAKPEDMGSEK